MGIINSTETTNVQPDEQKERITSDQNEFEIVNGCEEDNGTPSNPSKLEQSIINQVEYYFGDANMTRDKFMRLEIVKNNGWISLDTMFKFNRLAALTTDPNVVITALTKSATGLLEISEDGQHIRRHPQRPLSAKSADTKREIMSRSAYVKGFPCEITMVELIEFFQDHQHVQDVSIRKYFDESTNTNRSNGEVFVTFGTHDECAAFLSQEVQYNHRTLITKWKSEQLDDEKLDRQKMGDEKMRLYNKANQRSKFEYPKGSVLHITNITPDVTRKMIEEKLWSIIGYQVNFIDFSFGDDTAYVHLDKACDAMGLLAKLEHSKIQLRTCDATVNVLDGVNEVEYLDKCADKIKLWRQKKRYAKNQSS